MKTYKILSVFDDSLLAVIKTNDIEQTMSESIFFAAYYKECTTRDKVSFFFKRIKDKCFGDYKVAEFFIRFFIVAYIINAIILTFRNICFLAVFVISLYTTVVPESLLGFVRPIYITILSLLITGVWPFILIRAREEDLKYIWYLARNMREKKEKELSRGNRTKNFLVTEKNEN